MRAELYIGENKLDLFEDEDINLNSSVANIEDITKNQTEYTKSFAIPASQNNNVALKHYYDSNIDDGFDTRVKSSGKIEIGGIPFKEGKYRLNGAKFKNDKPTSYSINFWGNLVSFKDIFGKDKLNTLDLSSFDHQFNSLNVRNGLSGFLFPNSLIYSLFYNKQLYYNTDPTKDVNSETQRNIATNTVNGGIEYNVLKPSIKVIRIIEAIENYYGISFSRDYFGRSEFTELYLYLNNTTEELGFNSTRIDFDGGDNTFIDFATDIGTYTIEKTPTANYFSFGYNLSISPLSGFESINYTVKMYVNDSVYYEQSFTGGASTGTIFTDFYNQDVSYEVYFEIESNQFFNFSASLAQSGRRSGTTSPDFFLTTSSSNTIESRVIISEIMPDIETLEFLKGIFKKNKLVIIPTSETEFYVNTISDYYASGGVFDITEYTDFSEYEISRVEILNPISFKFSEPSTILQTEFKKRNPNYFGDLFLRLEDENGKILDGTEYEVDLPFEQIIYEKISDINGQVNDEFVYAGVFDTEINPVVTEPHLHYNTNIVAPNFLPIRNSSGNIDFIFTVNMPSHVLNTETPQASLVWGNEFNVYNGSIIQNTLYSKNYQSYINDIYNPKNRRFKFNVKNFPFRLITEISLDDIIQVKQDYYRIDSFNLGLLSGNVEFNLVKSFDTEVNPFYADRENIFADYKEQQSSVYIVNSSDITVSKIDLGFGVDWVAVSQVGNNVYFDFSEHLTRFDRIMNVEVTNNTTLQSFTISLTQTGQYIPSLEFYDELNSQYINTIIT